MNNEKSIFACYEEIKRREIKELTEKLKVFGGVAHFGPDYQGEGATGVDMPYVAVHGDEGPYDVRVHAASVDKDGDLCILGCPADADYPYVIKTADIAYGHISFITDSIPARTFTDKPFHISSLSREDLQELGFDTSDVDDATMERLASELGDDYCEQLFWTSLEIIAEDGFGITRVGQNDDEDEDD